MPCSKDSSEAATKRRGRKRWGEEEGEEEEEEGEGKDEMRQLEMHNNNNKRGEGKERHTERNLSHQGSHRKGGEGLPWQPRTWLHRGRSLGFKSIRAGGAGADRGEGLGHSLPSPWQLLSLLFLSSFFFLSFFLFFKMAPDQWHFFYLFTIKPYRLPLGRHHRRRCH